MGFMKLAAIAAGAAACATTASAQIQLYDADLSPDGSAYAVLMHYPDQPVLAIYDVDQPDKQPVAVGLGDIETGQLEWGGDDHVLLQAFGEQAGVDTVSGMKTLRVARWLSISKDKGEAVTLFGENAIGDYRYITTSSGALISTLPRESDKALFARPRLERGNYGPTRLRESDDTFVLSLLEVNLRNSSAKPVESGEASTIDWVVNENGDAVARIDQGSNDREITVYVRPTGKGSFTRIADFDFDERQIDDIVFYGLVENETAIQALATDKSGRQKVVKFNMDTGALGDAVFEPASGTVDAIAYDARRARAVRADFDGGVHHFSAADRTEQQRLENVLPGARAAIISKSQSGERMLVRALYADKPAEYFLFDKPAKRLQLIGREDG